MAACCLGAASFFAVSVTSVEARADDFSEVFLAISGGALLFGADVAFTAVNVRAAVEQEELEEGWMIAQTIVTAPQAVIGDGLMVYGASVRDDQEVVALLAPVSLWLNTLATFSTWSLASRRTEVSDRFGVSWLLGANITLTAAAFGGTISNETGHIPSLGVSIPELLIAIPETIGCAYASSQDEQGRSGWIALTAWSGALVIHGTVSLILELGRDDVSPPEEYYPTPQPMPVPEPEPPVKVVPEDYLNQPPPRRLDDFLNPTDPAEPPPAPEPPRPTGVRSSKRVAHATFAPKIAPTTLTEDGKTFVPGVMVFGRF